MDSWVDKTFQYGKNLKLGYGVIIEKDVIVGDNVKLGHRCTLKSGTRIGNNSVIDDHCITTGACWIGNNVNVRTGAVISKANIIEDWVFIGPGVVTNHTKHVNHGRENKIKNKQLLAYIGYGSIIGSQVSLLAGITICPQVIIGGGSVIVRDIVDSGVYFGSPVKRFSELPLEYMMELPEDAGEMYLKEEVITHLRKYIPYLVV